MRVEIMAGLEVRAQQQDKAGVRMVRRRAVDAGPKSVARARSGGADVGVAVVAVDAPGVKDSLVVEQLVTRPASGNV